MATDPLLKSHWLEYSRWTQTLQRDLAEAGERHPHEQSALTAQLAGQGISSDDPIYKQRMDTLLARQEKESASMQLEYQRMTTGPTYQILAGTGIGRLEGDYGSALGETTTESGRRRQATYEEFGSQLTAQQQLAGEDIGTDPGWDVDPKGSVAWSEKQKQQIEARNWLAFAQGRGIVQPGGAAATMEQYYTRQFGQWERPAAEVAAEKAHESSMIARRGAGGRTHDPRIGAAGGLSSGMVQEFFQPEEGLGGVWGF